MTTFAELRRSRTAAEEALEALERRGGAAGPDPRTKPAAAATWLAEKRKAVEQFETATAGLLLLTPLSATAEELQEACAILDGAAETDLDFWRRCARRTAESSLSTGQVVKVLHRAGTARVIVLNPAGTDVYLDDGGQWDDVVPVGWVTTPGGEAVPP